MTAPSLARFLALSLCLLPAINVLAAEEFVEGTHYQLVVPVQQSGDPDRIEVTEFFWYGCIHCYHFEPLISQWTKTIADDVDYVASPAFWNADMRVHARAFYTAKALGVLDTLHDAMFQAINVDRNPLHNQQQLRQLFGGFGVDATAFDKAFNSFGVASQLRQAEARARGARITGTPELMVAGKYRISGSMAGGQAAMLKVADFLVAKERAAR